MERENSIKCKYCNNEISAFAKKCPSCGQEIIQKEEITSGYEQYVADSKQKVEVKQNKEVKQNAGLQQNEALQQNKEINETSVKEKEQLEEQLQQEHQKQKRMGKRNQYIAIALVLVLVLSSFGLKWVLSRKEYLDTNNLLYYSKSGLAMYAPRIDKKEKLVDNNMNVWSEGMTNWVADNSMRIPAQYTTDKKYMFFLADDTNNLVGIEEGNRRYSLYYKENFFGAKPVLLAENVNYFVVSKENEVFYTKGDKQQLCKYDFEGEEVIVESIFSFQVDDSMTRFSYWTEDDCLYVQDLNQEKEPTLILKGYYYHHLSKDYTQMVYWDVDGTKELYILKDLKEKELIATNVQRVNTIERDGLLEVYYTVGDSANYTSYDLIEDIFLEQDLVIAEPNPEEYSNGEENPQYQLDKKEYREKQKRDVLRNALKTEILSQKPNELYYYKDGTTRKLRDQVLNTGINYLRTDEYEEQPCIISAQDAKIEKVKFTGEETYSELSDAVSNYYYGKYNDSLAYYACIPNEEGSIDFLKIGNLQYSPAVFDLKNKYVYSAEVITKQDKITMNLIKSSYSADTFGETEVCFSGNSMFSIQGLFNGNVFINQEGIEGNSPYCLWNDTTGKIDFGGPSGKISSVVESPEGNAIYYIDSSGSNQKMYRLNSDGTELLIAENVYSFYMMSDKEVFLITDYEEMTGYGTLRMYNSSGELHTIEEEVMAINNQIVALDESW